MSEAYWRTSMEPFDDVISDELGHDIHRRIWGGVQIEHNRFPDGEPSGDCYKCRIIRDEIRAALRKFGPGRSLAKRIAADFNNRDENGDIWLTDVADASTGEIVRLFDDETEVDAVVAYDAGRQVWLGHPLLPTIRLARYE